MLVPWIGLLAVAPAERWFGAPAEKWSWIVFDVVVFVALRHLLRRPSVIVATILALAVTSDFGLTVLSVARNPAITSQLASLGVAGLACLAPAVAATLLWGTRSRLARQRELAGLARAAVLAPMNASDSDQCGKFSSARMEGRLPRRR